MQLQFDFAGVILLPEPCIVCKDPRNQTPGPSTQQKLVLLKLEKFTLELRENNVFLGQECVFLDASNNTLVVRRNSLKLRA